MNRFVQRFAFVGFRHQTCMLLASVKIFVEIDICQRWIV